MIGKPYAKLAKRLKKKIKINKIMNENGDTTTTLKKYTT